MKKIPNSVKRTLTLNKKSYDEILKFFDSSPTNITGAAAIRELVDQLGRYCQQKRKQGQIASSHDFDAIRGIVLSTLENQDERVHPDS